MPSLPCPLGIDCKKGSKQGIWHTVDLPFQEAKQLLDDHVKFSHQLAVSAAGASAQIINNAKSPSEAERKNETENKSNHEENKILPTLTLCDLDEKISLKYCKNQKEYRCLEDGCAMSEYISLPRFKKHLADKHFVDTEMGRNNVVQKPHITRVIPEDERGGKFKCDKFTQKFHYEKDLDVHRRV